MLSFHYIVVLIVLLKKCVFVQCPHFFLLVYTFNVFVTSRYYIRVNWHLQMSLSVQCLSGIAATHERWSR